MIATMMILILIGGTMPVRSVRMAERRSQERGVSRRPKILDYIGAGGHEESEARVYADGMVRHARAEASGRSAEGSAPDPGTVRERREARQHSSEAP